MLDKITSDLIQSTKTHTGSNSYIRMCRKQSMLTVCHRCVCCSGIRLLYHFHFLWYCSHMLIFFHFHFDAHELLQPLKVYVLPKNEQIQLFDKLCETCSPGLQMFGEAWTPRWRSPVRWPPNRLTSVTQTLIVLLLGVIMYAYWYSMGAD